MTLEHILILALIFITISVLMENKSQDIICPECKVNIPLHKCGETALETLENLKGSSCCKIIQIDEHEVDCEQEKGSSICFHALENCKCGGEQDTK